MPCLKVILILFATVLGNPVTAAEVITIFVAASLNDPVNEIARRFQSVTQTKIRFSIASSSTLARQIEAGAEAQIFLSADQDWMDYLDERGFIEPATRRTPIANRLALVAPARNKVTPIAVIDSHFDFSQYLGDDARLVVGDPDHVPVGRYAEIALKALGHWSYLKTRLARTDNARAAIALMERGEAPLGIVYFTDALLSNKVQTLSQIPMPPNQPIAYHFAILKDQATPTVRALFDFLQSDEGIAVFTRSGFSLP